MRIWVSNRGMGVVRRCVMGGGWIRGGVRARVRVRVRVRVRGRVR